MRREHALEKVGERTRHHDCGRRQSRATESQRNQPASTNKFAATINLERIELRSTPNPSLRKIIAQDTPVEAEKRAVDSTSCDARCGKSASRKIFVSRVYKVTLGGPTSGRARQEANATAAIPG